MSYIENTMIEKKNTSGISGKGSRFIRKDRNSRNQDFHDLILTPYENLLALLGIIMYIIVFIITIPILLYKFKFITFLKLYFLNTDQVATVISFHEGVFKHIFKYIYNDTGPFIGFLSQSLINWSVLMGLFYVVITESRKKTVNDALSKLGFMLFLTYLLPGRYLIKLQEWFYNKIGGKYIYNKFDINGLYTILFGFCLVISTIIIEDIMVKNFSGNVKHFLDTLFKTI
jgi:hypothetical protein